MKCTVTIDKSREEEVLIYAHERNNTVNEILRIAGGENTELIGYADKSAFVIGYEDVYCFASEEGKVYAITENEKLQIKFRLYQIEEMAGKEFLKINQSCLVNVKKIERFSAAFSGTLVVKLKNGYTDYVSRRQLKIVKKRLGV